MALIKCPECGKDVSSTLKQCIHCGYVLNEEKPVEEKVEEQKVEAKVESQPIEQVDTCRKIYEKWKVGHNLLANTWVITLLLFIIIGAVLLFVITNNKPLNLFFAFFLFVVGYGGDLVVSKLKYDRHASLSSWIKENKINALEIVDMQLAKEKFSEVESEANKEEACLRKILTAMYFDSSESFRKSQMTNIILQAVLGFLSGLFFTLFVVRLYNVSLIIRQFASFPWFMMRWGALFIAIIFHLPRIIVGLVSDSRHNTLVTAFVKENCPNGYKNYFAKIKKLV